MIDLAAHIEYLLMSHDCVVTPGLGAFLVHESPALYDGEAGLFVPPSRTLGFNQAITINDGLLAESVARKEHISLDAARVEVDTAVDTFRHQLAETATLPVGGLGEMSAQGDVLLFEPSSTSTVALRYRGLFPVAVSPLVQEQSKEVVLEHTDEPRQKVVTIPAALKVAASVIILVLVCGVFFTTGNLIDSRQTNFASLDSGLRNNVESPVPVAVDEPLQISRDIELNIAVPKVELPEAAVQMSAPAPGRYLLVVGSFPNMKSALKHIGDNTTLSVIEMEGKYRVYAASASSMSEASTLADSLRAENPAVWICRR